MSWNKISDKITDLSGSSYTFLLAVLLIVAWIISGPLLGFSDTWQLIINTFTTLITFLMVFLIQNSQNRDQKRVEALLHEIKKLMGKKK